ncbi:outer membrane lipoprotein carrier protein LolA [Algoriphagus halophytocola]|uniref:Outer membrane lipoprotein carrier protein LolA n=1 Tax=Algoriphagus halophytocola TaxID=2991499 RepID=A0ABY6ME51_9BACT|nr:MULTISPECIES: outer membrane lipoprotein carrier protein LolA [unclassified Algoriphagus]UZD22050.1 outer membrane lipoprotein carrier protein LolA [Algoriphagus sp. TR-M5]WBL43301.1 outer membrane lipoprotein carrier protein LolA [Algoriphagus sp. TR-M9]
MKKITLLYTLLFALLISFQATAQKDPQAKTILDAMSQKFKDMNGFTASFDYTYQDGTGAGDVQSGEIAVKGEQYRLKLPDQEIFNDSKTVWTFIQSDNYKEVTINDASQMEGELTPSNIYRLYESGYNYSLLGEKQYQGKKVQVVQLIAENNNAPFEQVKLMIDSSNSNLLGWEMFDGQGGVFSYSFKNLKLNSNLPASHFAFDATKHPGIEIIDLR